jgi:hypothetical protein
MLDSTRLTFLPPGFDLALKIPLASFSVSAGLLSPVDDSLEGTVDLDEDFIRHPAATGKDRAST